jgi:hypothetical protein
VFKASSETLPSKRDTSGNIIYDYGDFNYTYKVSEDTLETIETPDHKEHYWLKKGQKEVTKVDHSALISPAVREVIVVDYGGEYYLVQPSVNKDKIMEFDPLPHDVKNLMRSEISLRKDRYKQKQKGLLAAMPWIFGIVAIIGIIGILITVGNGLRDFYKERAATQEFIAQQNKEAAEIVRDAVYIVKGYADPSGSKPPDLNKKPAQKKPPGVGV